MNTVGDLLKKKNNIAIIGSPGCEKRLLFKNILVNLVSNNRKVLVIEINSLRKNEQIILELHGDYILYENISSIDYNKNLINICFFNIPKIDFILRLIKEVEDKNVEVILIDGIWLYLEQCKQLISNINIQLIVSSQFIPHSLDIDKKN